MNKSIIAALVSTTALSVSSPVLGSAVLERSMPSISLENEFLYGPSFNYKKSLDALSHNLSEALNKALQKDLDAAIARSLQDQEIEKQQQINLDAAIARSLHDQEIETQEQIDLDAAIARSLQDQEIEMQQQIDLDAAIARSLQDQEDQKLFDVKSDQKIATPNRSDLFAQIRQGNFNLNSTKEKEVDEPEVENEKEIATPNRSDLFAQIRQGNFNLNSTKEKEVDEPEVENEKEIAAPNRSNLFAQIRQGNFNLNSTKEKEVDEPEVENKKEIVAPNRSDLFAQIRQGKELKPTTPVVKHVKKDPHLEAIKTGFVLKPVVKEEKKELDIPKAPDFRKVFKNDVTSEVDQARLRHQQNRGGLLNQIALGKNLKSVNGAVSEENRLAAEREQAHAAQNNEKVQESLRTLRAQKEAEAARQNEERRKASANAAKEQKLAEENIRQGLLPNGQKRQGGNILAEICNFKKGGLRKADERVLGEVKNKHISDENKEEITANLLVRRQAFSGSDDQKEDDGFWD